jgi:CHASE2 domain-containing sensor protein
VNEEAAMMVFSILAFAVVMFILSFLLGRRVDPGTRKIATTTTMIAWGSMCYGLFLVKTTL